MAKLDWGRPLISEDTFNTWLSELRPHLVLGVSLYRAIHKSGLDGHSTSIYEKYKLKDWFSVGVDRLRLIPGEKANEAMTRLIDAIHLKTLQEKTLTSEEIKILTFFSEKHRSAQHFFVNRTETSVARPIEDIISDLERADNIDDVAFEAEKQMVEAQPPIQSQE